MKLLFRLLLTHSLSGISSGDIAGIVLAGVTLLILLTAIAFYLRNKSRKKSRDRVDLLAGSSSGMTEVSSGGGYPFISGLLRGNLVNHDRKVAEASTIGHPQKSDMTNTSSSEPEMGHMPTSPVSLGPLSSITHGYYGQGTRETPSYHASSISEDATTTALSGSDSKVPNGEILNNTREHRSDLGNSRESRYLSTDLFSTPSDSGTVYAAMPMRSDNSPPPPYPD
jgi:hypothetical protein